MVCGLWLIRAQCCLLSSSLHVNMHSLSLLAWFIDKFISSDSRLSDALFHRTNLSMKRYDEVDAARLSDFLYNWCRSLRWSETMCLPDTMLSWRHTIRKYSHRVCIAGLFKYLPIAQVSRNSFRLQCHRFLILRNFFFTCKSTGLWQTCVISTDTDNVYWYCTHRALCSQLPTFIKRTLNALLLIHQV